MLKTLNNSKFLSLLSICILILVSCGTDQNENSNDNGAVEFTNADLDKFNNYKGSDTFPLIRYSHLIIKDKEHLDSIKQAFVETPENPALNKMFCTLNRKERRFLKVGDSVLVADSLIPNMVAYSIFPFYYHGARDIKKLLVVSNKYQAYACYEYGKQVRFAATNTGKEKTPSYPGRYAMVWKAELRLSSLDSTWKMPYTWNIHKYSGSAFHKFDMPGYPASHSCMRQFLDDAKWLYKWGEGAKYDSVRKTRYMTGTPVIIIDNFDYTRPRTGPWVALKSNKDVFLKLPDKPMEVEEALIPISQIPEVVRGGLPNRKRYLYAEDTLRARGIIRPDVKLTVSVDFNKKRRIKAEKKRKELELKQKQLESELKIDTNAN